MSPETLATNLYLGRIVSVARQRKGLTQHGLAKAAGLGSSLIMDIEVGRASLNSLRREALIRALGLQPDALDAPGFAVLSPAEQRLIAEARRASTPAPRHRLLRGRLKPAGSEAAPC